MGMSDRSRWAVEQMRWFQQLEEKYRKSAQNEYEKAKEALARAYTRTNRETLGSFDKTISRRALDDTTRKELVGDENFFRGLTEMYASIAMVELAVDRLRDDRGDYGPRPQGSDTKINHLRDVSASRTERAVG